MAGQPENVDRDTGQRFDGSALIAMKADPSFTQLRFCELNRGRPSPPLWPGRRPPRASEPPAGQSVVWGGRISLAVSTWFIASRMSLTSMVRMVSKSAVMRSMVGSEALRAFIFVVASERTLRT
jgi:hypothetical protein